MNVVYEERVKEIEICWMADMFWLTIRGNFIVVTSVRL